MEFPYYGHLVFWFWFDIFLAFFGILWLEVLVCVLRQKAHQPFSLINWIFLFWFVFWLPHSLYLSLELIKHLMKSDGVLEPATVNGVLIYAGVSLAGLLSCLYQISISINEWEKYQKQCSVLVGFLVIGGASFGVLIGLYEVNFYHLIIDPVRFLAVVSQIIFLQNPRDPLSLSDYWPAFKSCGDYWPVFIGGLLFFILGVFYLFFGKYIKEDKTHLD